MTIKIEDILKKQFPDLNVAGDVDALTIGSAAKWDSLNHFNLLLLIESSYGVRFSNEEISELKTVGVIRAALKKKGVAV
jgi:acyl carrier protein